MKTLCVLIALGIAFMGGWFCAIDACNSFMKVEVPSPLPDYEPAKYYRYGGEDGFENQMDRIRFQGKQELVEAWDEFQIELWPWDTIKTWRKL